MGNCKTCTFWANKTCNRAGSPHQGEPTGPDDGCEMHAPKRNQLHLGGLKLTVIETSALPENEVMMVGSINTCPGTSLVCPTCFGLPYIVDTCTACSGTGRVGLAEKQPGIVRLINIGEA